MNEQNLISFADRDPVEHKEISARGGRASSRAKAGRRLLKESLDDILSEEGRQDKVCEALVRRAEKGDVRAYQAIAQTLGEDVRKLELSRGDTQERERFIAENADTLLELMHKEIETGERSITQALGLTYEERKRLLEHAMLQDLSTR